MDNIIQHIIRSLLILAILSFAVEEYTKLNIAGLITLSAALPALLKDKTL